jgi:hypothetical protein
MSQEGSDNTAIQQGTAGSPMKKNPRGKVSIILTIIIVLYYTVLFFFFVI